MAGYKNSISIGIKIDDINKVKNNLQKQLDGIKGINAKIDTAQIDVSKIKSTIQTQLNSMNFKINIGNADASGIDNVINKTKQATQEANQFKNVMGKSLNIGDGAKAFEDLQKRANEIRNTVDSLAKINFNTSKNGNIKDATITYTNSMGKLVTETMKWKEIMNSTEGVAKRVFTTTNVNVSDNIQQLSRLEAKVEFIKSKMQGKLTTANVLGIDPTLISQLQTQLNGLNAKTPIGQINQLQQQINALGNNSTANINKLQSAINSLTTRINNIKVANKKIIDNNDISELKTAENEVEKLGQLLTQVKSGKIIDGKVISSEVLTARNSVNQLSSAINGVRTNVFSLGNAFKSVFSYAVGGSAIYAGIRELRQGLSDIKNVDDALRDLKRVSDDVANNTLNNFSTQANNMAQSLGNSTESVIQAVTTFKQLGYSWNEAKDYMAKESIILANVGDMNASDSSNSIVATLKGFKLEAKDTTMVVDSLNEAGNKFAIKTGELAEGLRVSSAALALANNDLYQSEALITTGTEVLRDSNEVGVGLKTISMRLNQVKTTGGETFFKLKNDLKNLANTDLTDVNGNLRSTYDVIIDLSKAWESGKLSDMDKSKLLDETAGKQQSKVMASIIQNASQLPKIYETLKSSSGSAEQEQARFMDSISGKLNAFKETVKAVWLNLGNSNGIKSLLSGATSVVGGLNNIIKAFGVMPATIMVVTTALSLFNAKFRESMSIYQPTFYSNWITQLGNVKTRLTEKIVAQKAEIEATKAMIIASREAGVSTTGLQTQLAGMQTGLVATTIKEVACTVATTALQIAFTMGLSLAITGAIAGLSSLGTWLFSTSNSMKDCSAQAKTLSDSLQLKNNTDDLFKQYKEINDKLKEGNLEESKRQEYNKQLYSIKDKLVSLDDDYKWVLNDQNKTYDEQLTLLKNIYEQKLKANAKELDKNMDSQGKVNALMNGDMFNNGMTKDIELYKKIQEALSNPNPDGTVRYNNLNMSAEEAEKTIKSLKDGIKDSWTQIETYNHDVGELQDANYKTSRSMITVSDDTKKFITDLTGTGQTSIGVADKIKTTISAINELDTRSDISTGTLSKLSKTFPDLGINASNAKEKVSQFKNELSKNSNLFSDAQKELHNTGTVSEATVNKLAEAFPNLGINAKNAGDTLNSLDDTMNNLNDGTDKQAEVIAKATEEYQKSTQAIAKAQGYIDKLNKVQAVTPELAGQIAKKYDDIGTSINSVGSTIDFLKGKIQEQQEAQENALMIMKGDDADYYKEKVANNQDYEDQINDFLARFTGNSQQAYNVDLSQFTTLNQMKAGVQSTLKSAVDSFMSQFVDTSAEGYKVDYANFTTLINAKKEAMKAIAGAMSGYWDDVSQDFSLGVYGELGGGGGTYMPDNVSDETIKKYEGQINKVNGIKDKIKESEASLDKVYAGGGLNFKGFDGGGSDFSGTGSPSKGNGGSGKSAEDEAKKAQEELVKSEKDSLKKITDAYDEAKNNIEDNIEEINYNEKLLGDSNDGKNFVKKMELTNQKLGEQKKIVDEADKQLQALKNTTVSTEEAQKTLSSEVLKASKELRNEKLEVASLNEEMKKLSEEQVKKKLETQQKLEEIQMEVKQKKEKKDLTYQIYGFTEDEWNTYKNSQKDEINQEISDLQTRADADSTNISALDALKTKQQELNEVDSESYNNIKDFQSVYEEIHNQRLTYIDEELKALEKTHDVEKKENDLLEKKKSLTEAQISLEKTKNDKSVYTYKKNEQTGVWDFEWHADTDAIKKAQDTYDKAKKELDDYNSDQEYETKKSNLEQQKADEETLLKIKKTSYDKQEKALEETQATEKSTFEYHYSDMDKLVEQEMKDLATKYGDNWKVIYKTIDQNLTDVEKRYDNLAKMKAILGIDGLASSNKTTNNSNIAIGTTTDVNGNVVKNTSKNDIVNNNSESQVKQELQTYTDALQNKLDIMTKYATQMIKVKAGFESSILNLQNVGQKAQYDSYTTFALKYSNFSDKFLELLQLIYDFRFTNIVNLSTHMQDLIKESLLSCEEAYKKFVAMSSAMGIDVNGSIDISSALTEFEKYKQSVADWTKTKEDTYTNEKNNPLTNPNSLYDYESKYNFNANDISKNPLYNTANASNYANSWASMFTSDAIAQMSNINLNSFGVSSLNSQLGTVINKSNSSSDTYYQIDKIEMTATDDPVATFNSIVEYANQKAVLKSQN